MKVIIRDLCKDHRPIYDMIQKRTLEQGNKFNDSCKVEKSSGGYGFCWMSTPEGHSFWKSINLGDFDIFYERYPGTLEKFSDKYKFKIGDRVKCKGISEELTIYAYEDEKSSYLATGCKVGHNGRGYDLYDDNGNIMEQLPYDGTGFWFVDDNILTKVSAKTSSEPKKYWEQIHSTDSTTPYYIGVNISEAMMGISIKKSESKLKSKSQLQMIPVRKIKVRNDQNN